MVGRFFHGLVTVSRHRIKERRLFTGCTKDNASTGVAFQDDTRPLERVSIRFQYLWSYSPLPFLLTVVFCSGPYRIDLIVFCSRPDALPIARHVDTSSALQAFAYALTYGRKKARLRRTKASLKGKGVNVAIYDL